MHFDVADTIFTGQILGTSARICCTGKVASAYHVKPPTPSAKSAQVLPYINASHNLPDEEHTTFKSLRSAHGVYVFLQANQNLILGYLTL